MNGTFIANQFVPGTSHNEVRTLITFDNGVEWRLMEAPELNINQEEIECELVCNYFEQNNFWEVCIEISVINITDI